MSTRKKKSDAELEQQLIAEANDPKAWGRPVTVPVSLSPRPALYRRDNEEALCRQPIVP